MLYLWIRYGPTCMVGGYVQMYNPNTPITKERVPCLLNQHPDEPHRSRDLMPMIRSAAKKLAREVQ